jgi:hypothetical protein
MTKQKILLALICLIKSPLFSQNYSFYETDFFTQKYHVEKTYVYSDDFVDSFALSNRLKKIEIEKKSYNKRQAVSYTTKAHVFDVNGRLIEHVTRKDTGKKQKISITGTRIFNEFGKVESSNHFFYGDIYFKLFKYNDAQQVVKECSYDRKGIYSVVDTHYDTGNLSDMTTYKNKKGRVLSVYRYMYYPNRQFKQIVLSDRKGKIKKVWDYSCDETGKSLKKLKDTAKICTLKSYLPDGTTVTTMQSFDFYGKPWKMIKHTDSNGRTLQHEYYAGKEERLINAYTYRYQGHQLAQSSQYNFYDKKHHKKELLYDTAGRITSEINTVYRRQSRVKTYQTNYVYNALGLITEKTVSMDGRLSTIETFRYEFYTKN